MTSWVYLPPWGLRAVAAVGAALLLFAAVRAVLERPVAGGRGVRLRRQLVPLALRVVVIAALLFVALNPTALLPRETGGKPRLIVLVDTSASMATRDVGGRSRLEAALEVVGSEANLRVLNDGFLADTRTFDKEVRAADLARLSPEKAVGKATDLAAALSTAIGDLAGEKSQAGVLLVSDGRATTQGATEAARLALARSVPLWTWCLGGEVARRDVWLEVSGTDALAFAGADVVLAATLHQEGYPNRSFKVDLLKGDAPVASREVVPDPTGQARLSVQVKAPDAGEHRYVFRVAPQADEMDATNNERSVFLRVVGEKVRVLLAEGQPHWDTKFLVQCLKRDDRVDLTAVYHMGGKRFFAIVSSKGEQRRESADLFPRTQAAMDAFDLVIFGRGCETFFDRDTEKLLSDFVSERGGGVVFARGRAYGGRFFPLAKLEPVVWGDGLEQNVHPRLTDAGRESPIFEIGAPGADAASDVDGLIASLPALDQANATTGEKPLAAILATTDGGGGDPSGRTILLAYQRYGQGKVVTINASGLWRWAFREKSQEEADAVYARFWSALVRWVLAGSDFLPGADVALRTARRTYTDEQPLRFLITTKGLDAASYRPRLTVRGPGRAVDVEPRAVQGGAYAAEAGPVPPGTYQVTLENNVGKPPELSTQIEVVSASVENRALSADPDTMRRLAEVSGGLSLTAAQAANMPLVVRRWEAARQLAAEKATLWDRWWFLAGILALLGLEWLLRRREGLL